MLRESLRREWMKLLQRAKWLASDHLPVRTSARQLLAKVHRIMEYVQRSTAGKEKLREAQAYHGLPQKTLPKQHCATQWWSTTALVQAFVANEHAIRQLCLWADVNAEKEELPSLTSKEWKA